MALPSQYDPKLWIAMLHEIDAAGGSARPRDLYPRLRSYFPSLTDADLSETLDSGGNRFTNRVQWARQTLVYCGCLDSSRSGYWTLTSAGRAWLTAVWKGKQADYSGVAKPPRVILPKKRTSGSRRKPPTPPSLDSVVILTDPAELLCQRLAVSQRKSTTPVQFEQDLAAAFAFLGFNTRHVGGSREADIFLTAPLGQLQYSVIVDAKSSHSGRIPDSQINWSVIANYQMQTSSTHVAVVGEQFSGGQLHNFANQHGVTLITTQMLSDILRLHARTPFNLMELKDLFLASGLATVGFQALQERNRSNEQHWSLILDVIETIADFQKQASSGFALKVDQLYPVLYRDALARGSPQSRTPTQQDVMDAVGFLASRAVNVLAEVAGSGGAYQLTALPEVARRRFQAMARYAVDSRSWATQSVGTSLSS